MIKGQLAELEAMVIKQQTPSVIARLMGLDALPHQHSIQKQQRVLSENYLCKSASIGIREKQSLHGGRSFRMNRCKQSEFKDLSEVPQKEIYFMPSNAEEKESPSAIKERDIFKKQTFTGVECVEMREKILGIQVVNSGVEGIHSDKSISWKHFPQQNVVFPNSPHDLQGSRPHSPSGQVAVFKSIIDPILNSRKTERSWKRNMTTARKNASLRSFSTVENVIHRNSNSYESKTSGKTVKNKGLTDLETQVTDTSSAKLPRSEAGGDDTSVTENQNKPSFTRVANKQFSERQKMVKRIQEVGTTNRCRTLNELLFSSNQKISPTNLNCKLEKPGLCDKFSLTAENSDVSNASHMKNDFLTMLSRFRSFSASFDAIQRSKSRNQNEAFHNGKCLALQEAVSEAGDNMSRSQNISGKESEFNISVQKAGMIWDELGKCFEEVIMSKTDVNDSSPCITASEMEIIVADVVKQDQVKAIEIADVELLGQEPKEQQSGTTSCQLMVKRGIYSAQVLDSSDGQLSSTGSLVEEMMFSNSKSDPEYAASLRDAYQPSPNSVLEPPFEQEILADCKIFESGSSNLQGLWMQLQLLKSEAEDAHTDGPEMMVSSDESTREGSVDFSKENGKLMYSFRAEESRNFSYLSDVLDEAGFHDANWEINTAILYSSKSVVESSVFDVLEKKYGDQISWKKAERRLLFDCINSGLMMILQPCVNIHKWACPLTKRINTKVRRDVIEEELWNLLVSQENEESKSLSEKAVGGDTRWLDLGDDIDFIVSDIEKVLLDDIAEEFGSI